MYTSGFLGSMNAALGSMTSGVGNWFRAGVLALGLGSLSSAGCTSETFPDGHIPPLDQPDPDDTTIDDTPTNNLRTCFPPDTAGDGFSVMVESTGARFGTEAPVNGLFRMSFAANSILPDDPDAPSTGTVRFTARGRWNNAPSEWLDHDPSQPIGPLGLMTQVRLDGSPLTNSSMTKPGVTGAYASRFPTLGADAGKLGFHWMMDGILHYTRDSGVTNCGSVEILSIRSDARTTSGFSAPSQDFVVLSPYAPRADGQTSMPEYNFANEFPVALEGDLGVFTLQFSGDFATACAAGECLDVNGIANPSGGVRMRLIRNTASSAHSDAGTGGAGGADGGSDAGMGGSSDSGGSGG